MPCCRSYVRKPYSFMIAAFALLALATGYAPDWSQAQAAAENGGPAKEPAAAIENSSAEKVTAVADAFRQDFPNVKFTKVLESGIEGLYEVIMGTNIVYYAPAAHKVIAGDVFDTSGLNITDGKRQMLRTIQETQAAKLLDTLPLDKAVKIGAGKNIVIEFTDIDCPYCRKVEGFFKDRTDITRFVFLMPLDQIHPKSAAKSRQVLCSPDPVKAYETAMAGGLDTMELKGCGSREKEIDEVLSQHRAAAGTMGVEGTPVIWVNKRQVTGADTKKLEEYLTSQATGTAPVSGS